MKVKVFYHGSAIFDIPTNDQAEAERLAIEATRFLATAENEDTFGDNEDEREIVLEEEQEITYRTKILSK